MVASSTGQAAEEAIEKRLLLEGGQKKTRGNKPEDAYAPDGLFCQLLGQGCPLEMYGDRQILYGVVEWRPRGMICLEE